MSKPRRLKVDGVFYGQVTEAARAFGINASLVHYRCNSDLPQWAGWQWLDRKHGNEPHAPNMVAVLERLERGVATTAELADIADMDIADISGRLASYRRHNRVQSTRVANPPGTPGRQLHTVWSLA